MDTNILVRFITRDDVQQARAAERALRRATRVVVTLPCLCELIWVLGRTYGFSRDDMAATLEVILEVPNIEVDRASVVYGIAMVRAGGDFADGVIAFEGRRAGGDRFISLDKKAIARVRAQGFEAELP